MNGSAYEGKRPRERECQDPPDPDPEPDPEFELELAVGEGGVTGSGDRPGISEAAEPAKTTCLLVDGSR